MSVNPFAEFTGLNAKNEKRRKEREAKQREINKITRLEIQLEDGEIRMEEVIIRPEEEVHEVELDQGKDYSLVNKMKKKRKKKEMMKRKVLMLQPMILLVLKLFLWKTCRRFKMNVINK